MQYIYMKCFIIINIFYSNKKLAVVKLEENKVLYNESCMDKNKIKDLIKKIEGETSAFIKNCQELYNNEIRNVSIYNHLFP